MIQFARTVRLLPLVIVAAVSLFALKISGLLFDGGYTLGERLAERGKPQLTITSADSVPAYPKIIMADGTARSAATSTTPSNNPRLSWAEQMFNYGNANPDITGSVPEPQKGTKLKVSEKPPAPTKLEPNHGSSVVLGAGGIVPPGERAILQRLQQRRKELDKRSRNLDMRESLLKAAEKRVEARVNELKDLEKKLKVAAGARDKKQEEHFNSLIAMYEAMKPKEAARIFDRLDMGILVEVATGMKARSMSAIMAQMTPDAAERLTVELANRAAANEAAKMANPDKLPKIGGNPGGR